MKVFPQAGDRLQLNHHHLLTNDDVYIVTAVYRSEVSGYPHWSIRTTAFPYASFCSCSTQILVIFRKLP